METPFDELLTLVSGVDLTDETVTAINENHVFAENLNRQQLDEGITGEGKRIQAQESPLYDIYAPSTVKRKIRKGQPIDRVTLKDKGDLYEGLEYKADRENVTVDSKAEHTIYMTKRYGEQVLSLTDQSKEELWDEKLQPTIVISFCEKTGCGYGV